MPFWSPWPGERLFFALLGFPCLLLCDLGVPRLTEPLSPGGLTLRLPSVDL